MAKRSKTVEPETIENPRLTPEQYWEWRTTIAELEAAKKSHEVMQLQLASAKKDIEILTLKSQVFSQTQLKNYENAVKDAEKEYDAMKYRLEALLSISLNDKLIDAHTFEVKDAL